MCLIIQVAEKTDKVFRFSTVHSHNFRQHKHGTALSCCMQGFEDSPLFALQRSTRSRGTRMAAPVIYPSCMMASGSTTALVSGVRTVTSGVPPPTTTARMNVGASVLSRVSFPFACSVLCSYAILILYAFSPCLTNFLSPSLTVRQWLWDILGYWPADRQLLPV